MSSLLLLIHFFINYVKINPLFWMEVPCHKYNRQLIMFFIYHYHNIFYSFKTLKYMLGYLIGIYIFTKGCYDEKTKAYEADHSDPADRDIACHHRIYYLFCSERKPVILDVTVFDVFLSDLFMGNVIFV